MFVILFSGNDKFIEHFHWSHNSSSEPTRNWLLTLFIVGKNFHFWAHPQKISLLQLSLKSIGSSWEGRAATNQLNIGDQILPLISFTFLQALTDEILNSSEAIFLFFRKVNFRCNEQFFSKDNLIFIWQFEDSVIGIIVIRNELIFAL